MSRNVEETKTRTQRLVRGAAGPLSVGGVVPLDLIVRMYLSENDRTDSVHSVVTLTEEDKP
jgi:hypothetical protein